MKNLKRALSFALATVMLVGMMVVGVSAADFGDADQIEHTDAVNTLVALNVINGKDDGNYDPDGIVTRAEMAKLITVALNGGKDPVLGTKAEPTYTDIKGHWAEAYIEYCASLGIISGRGDGTFDPNGTVTGNEAAKMMLVAMGWDATIFNFTGASWAINVGVEANKVNLFDELETINPAEGLTRDNTAQLVYNGILAPVMEKSPNMSVTNGNITWDYTLMDGTLGAKKTIFSSKFSGLVFIGTFDGNTDTLGLANDGYIQVDGKLDTEADGSEAAYAFPGDFDIANVGEQVKVLFKDGKGGTTGKPDSKDTVYGIFNTGATTVYNYTRNDVKNGSDSPSAANKIKIGSTEYKIATPDNGDVLVVTNYGAGTTQTVTNAAGSANASARLAEAKAAFEGLKVSQNGSTIKFVTNDKGEIIRAYVVDTVISYVTAVNSGKVTINGVGSIKIEDNDVYEGIAKNDIVTYTKFYDSDKDDAFFTVAKAETVSGEMTGYKAATNVVLDGTTYKLNNKTLASATIGGDATTTSLTSGLIGETFTAYMVNGYVGYLMQDSESLNDYALVIDFNSGVLDSTFNVPKAQLLLADGTKVTAELHKDSVLKINGANNLGSAFTNDTALAAGAAIDTALEKGQIVKYTETSDGVYKIEEIGTYAANSSAVEVYDKDTKSFKGTVAAGDCPLFVLENGEYKVYNVRNLNDVSCTNSGYTGYYVKDGKVVAAYTVLASRPSGASADMFYGIVTGFTGTVKVDGDYYKQYSVANDAETLTVLLPDTGANAGTLTTGELVGFEKANDDVYTNTQIIRYTGTAFDANNGLATWVKEYNEADATLTYFTGITGTAATGFTGISATATTKALDDDCVIVYVNADDDEAGEEIGINAFDGVTGYRNVLIVEDNGKIAAILVESSGETHVIDTSATTLDAGKTADNIKAATTADGVYVPKDASFVPAGNAMSGEAAAQRIFKFTGLATTQNYTLTIKNAAGKTVYTETANLAVGGHFFYITTNPVSTNAGTEAETWVGATDDKAPTGTYSYTIHAATDDVDVVAGFFEV